MCTTCSTTWHSHACQSHWSPLWRSHPRENLFSLHLQHSRICVWTPAGALAIHAGHHGLPQATASCSDDVLKGVRNRATALSEDCLWWHKGVSWSVRRCNWLRSVAIYPANFGSQGPPRHGGRSTIAIQPRVLSTWTCWTRYLWQQRWLNHYPQWCNPAAKSGSIQWSRPPCGDPPYNESM